MSFMAIDCTGSLQQSRNRLRELHGQVVSTIIDDGASVLKDGLNCLNRHGQGLLAEGTHQARGMRPILVTRDTINGAGLADAITGIVWQALFVPGIAG